MLAKLLIYLPLCSSTLWASECVVEHAPSMFDKQQIKEDMAFLTSDTLKGRESGHEGAQLARHYIAKRYQELGLLPTATLLDKDGHGYFSPFILESLFSDRVGVNVIAKISSNDAEESVIVITAHYDHLGFKKGRIYAGADDNASGVSALLAIASVLAKKVTRHTYYFVATEYEEQGLFGAKAFVANPPVPLENIKLNINLDMLSQPGRRNKLYIAGTKKTPVLAEVLQPIVDNNPCIAYGHDGLSRSAYSREMIDWRRASDHWPFLSAGIPYLFFGVDDHHHYHRTTDNLDNVNWPFYLSAVESIITAVEILDKSDLP